MGRVGTTIEAGRLGFGFVYVFVFVIVFVILDYFRLIYI